MTYFWIKKDFSQVSQRTIKLFFSDAKTFVIFSLKCKEYVLLDLN